MKFVLSFMILTCSVRITKLDRFTPADVYFMHVIPSLKIGHALINYTGHAKFCYDAWNWKYYPEIPYVYLYCNTHYQFQENKPSSTNCYGFDCWESQFSIVSRVEIVEIMNRYREKVAKGSCKKWCEKNKHSLIFELAWNYYLEQNATNLLKNCSRNNFISRVFTTIGDDEGPKVPAYEEGVVTSFQMETGLQSELRSIIWRLIIENYLKDWDEESQFRRGDMHELACAFVCRRNVDLFVTDLNETVINGIVGHFSCVFVTTLVNITVLKNETYNGTVVIPVETTLKPSKKSCSQIDSSAWLYGVKQNYYPTLCRRNPSSYVSNVLIYDACDHRPQNIKDACVGLQYSPITWEEKFYGLILRHIQTFDDNTTLVDVKGQCNVPLQYPKPEKFGPDIMNYFCTLKEIVAVQANTRLCSGWNCADSQLTDATRLQILQLLNDARNKIAKGDCSAEECSYPCKGCNVNVQYCNMVNVQWHWYLERKASEVVRNCPTKNRVEIELEYDDDPFPVNHQTSYDEVTVIFDLPFYEGQLALPKTFMKLFWMNAFGDWTDFGYFIRANAQFIGCSIISRPYTLEMPKIEPEMNFYNGIPTHMVCIYATLNGSFISILDESNEDCCPTCDVGTFINPCWSKYFKKSLPFESLCSTDQLILSMNCQVGDRCDDDSISKAWHIQYEGLTVIQSLNGSLIPISHAAFNSIGMHYERKYCRFIVGLFLLQIWLWILILCFIYSCDDISVRELLKKTFTITFEFRLPKFISNLKSKEKPPLKEIPEKISKQEDSFEKKPFEVESTTEIPFSKDTSDSDEADSISFPVSEPKEETLPPEIETTTNTTQKPEPITAPTVKKTPVRKTSTEDDFFNDDSEMEPAGPTKTIGVIQVPSMRMFTGRPPKERKPPKRAKGTELPPLFKAKK